MPMSNVVDAKVRPHVRKRVEELKAALNATAVDVYSAAITEFSRSDRATQRAAIARVHRADGVRHPRLGRGNKIPA